MPTYALRAFAPVIASLCLAAPVLADDAIAGPRDPKAAFLADHPGASIYVNPEGIATVYGEAFSGGASPKASGAAFVRKYAPMFAVTAEELLPQSLLDDHRPTQPVWFERETGTYKFTMVYYTQYASGYPVFRADLRLLVRNDPGSPLVLATSALRNLGGFTVPAGAQKQVIGFKAAQAAAAAAHPGVAFVNFTKPELVVWGGIDATPVIPALCYQFEADTGDIFAPGFQHRRFLVDALRLDPNGNAMIVFSDDRIYHFDVTGSIHGMATNNANAAVCSSLTSLGLPYAKATFGATSVFANANGDFTIPTTGSAPFAIGGSLAGRFFQVFEPGSVPAGTLSQSLTPPATADFLFNTGLAENTTAEVNAYRHANIDRDYVLTYNPAFPTVSNLQPTTGFPVNVMVSGTCNAFFSPGNPGAISFFPTGGGCNNTAFGSVVYHEFGHNVVEKGGSGQGQYGEGYGDSLALAVTDDPITGTGFQSCSAGIRTANNTMQYPCSGEIHTCGTLLSGCVWSLRNQLIVSNPSTYRDMVGNFVVNSVLSHSGSSIAPDITITFLTLDDNDGNINNGTPHYTQIQNAFTAHNMPGPAVQFLTFTYPSGRPTSLQPGTPVGFPVQVSAGAATPQPGTGQLFLNSGSGFSPINLTQTSPNNYTVTLPGFACGSTVTYYLAARATDNTLATDPPNAPTNIYSPTIGTARFSDNFQTSLAWTVVNTPTGTFTGQWERGVPVSGTTRGEPLADADGSGMCYVTQNAAGNFDVDNGTTVLTSPVMDATGGPATLSYYRWYNNAGSASNALDDPFVVEISNNNGGTWTVLDTVPAAGPGNTGGWVFKSFALVSPTNQFRVRFTASDLGTPSLVEAGVDGVSLLICTTTCAADFDQNGTIDPADVASFVSTWSSGLGTGNLAADFDQNGVLTPADIAAFVNAWFNALTNGC